MLPQLMNTASHSPRRAAKSVFRLLTAVALIMPISPSAFAASQPIDPTGLWSTKDDESIIRIAPCSTPPAYCGTIVWLKEPLEKGVPKADDLNPDLAKRGRPIMGMETLIDFVAEKDHWKGKAYNADDGKTWAVTFKVQPDKVNGDKAEITGCLVWPLCRSETFTKVQAIPGGDPAPPAANAPHGTSTKTAPLPVLAPPPQAHSH